MILDPMLREQVSSLDLSDGLILLLLFCIFMYMTFKDLSESSGAEESITGSSFWDTKSVNWSLVAVGAVGLAIGGELVITHGVALAAILGVSSTIIGIGLVAIGTSLPELVTSIIAALKKEADLCVGNIVGSNIFNLLLVLPITAIIYPIKTDASGALDIGVSLALTAFLVIIFLLNKGVMGKPLGALFLLGYFFYMSYRIFI